VTTSGPLSDSEMTQFFGLLHRFCEEELDQWELWALETKYGDVFINISRYPSQPGTEEAYRRLSQSRLWPR
jgi:hypothetical protein